MTLTEFKKQSNDERFDTVFSSGHLMSRRSYLTKTVLIFSIDDFFVKMSLLKSNHEVEEITAYSAGELPLRHYRQMSAFNPVMFSAIGASDLLLEMAAGWAPSFEKMLLAA